MLTAAGAAAARALVAAEGPQVAVIDVHMPGEDGLSLARWLRVEHPGIGIVMLSAAAETIDRIVGLEVGADDYVAKPFELRELLARVKGLLRRTQPAEAAAAEKAAASPAPPAADGQAAPEPARMAFGTCSLALELPRARAARRSWVRLTVRRLQLRDVELEGRSLPGRIDRQIVMHANVIPRPLMAPPRR